MVGLRKGSTDAANRPPSFTEGATATRSVAENTAAGAAFGDAVAATDPDGDTLTYSLSGADASSFAIDKGAGQLKTRAALDYEGTNTYRVTITASDGSLSDTVAVTISVTNVNEAPAFIEGAKTTRSVPESVSANAAIGDAVSAADAEGDTLTYILSGTDASSFAIDKGTGQLKTRSALRAPAGKLKVLTVAADDLKSHLHR